MPARPFRRGDRVILVHERARSDADAADAAGPVFVLVHGLGMGHAYWGDLVEQLESSGRVLALDLPGFGDSPKPRTVPSIAGSAELLAAMLRAEGLHRPVLVGHSSGAQVVAEAAARHPELVDRIVLIAPSVNPRERTAVQQAARFVQDVAVIDPTALETGASAYLESGFGWTLANLRPMLEHRMELVLPRVRAATLVIRGEQDHVVPQSWAQAVATLVPQARYAEIAHRGHETTSDHDGPLHELIARHALGEPVGRELAVHERRAALSRSLGGGTTERVGWILRDYAYGIRRRLDQFVVRRPPARWRHGDPTRPDVVLATGLHEHWSFLAPLADALNRAGHRIVVVEGLGMNRHPVPETSHRLQLALARVAPPPAGRVIVGHSKGGLIAKHLLTDLERGTGPLAADGRARLGVRGSVSLATPYAGSARARWFLDPSMRAFLPTDAAIVELQRSASVNARIVSIFGTLDAHVPEGSALPGATNVIVPAAGHFRLTASPAAHRATVEAVASLASLD
ncbi:pimeloyl-ACP methyl ester carboxylesterase [Agromyces terreus]|uniref:Pimeloyl-ACP methyl ester carboxylesterase n=1 Tax=Agromyces terreus TaxID=424795 RepID=A0A9X2KAX8_9MICO|nr:alpha/beta hydrolase [Agromyces terreus]MCP2370823.1 pimeloyl-ACP methyl ester carboxylesterase [Agromyces terreus]